MSEEPRKSLKLSCLVDSCANLTLKIRCLLKRKISLLNLFRSLDNPN